MEKAAEMEAQGLPQEEIEAFIEAEMARIRSELP